MSFNGFKIGDLVSIPCIRFGGEINLCSRTGNVDSYDDKIQLRIVQLVSGVGDARLDCALLHCDKDNIYGFTGVQRQDLFLDFNKKYWFANINHITLVSSKPMKVKPPVNIICRSCGNKSLWIKGTKIG